MTERWCMPDDETRASVIRDWIIVKVPGNWIDWECGGTVLAITPPPSGHVSRVAEQWLRHLGATRIGST